MTNKLHRIIGLGLVLGVGVTACSSSHPSAATSDTTAAAVAPATSASTVASPSTTVGSAPTTTTGVVTTVTTPSGPGTCQTSQLKGSLTGADGTAGSIYYQLVLTNKGSSTCVIDGYPGVSFVTGNSGQQVGAPAERTTGAAAPVTLAPGASTSAILQITDAGNYAPCGNTATDGLRVYPPNQRASLLIAHTDQACADTSKVTLHVGPFKA